MTANSPDIGGWGRTFADDGWLRPIFEVCCRASLDNRPAVFKTACGLRNPRGGYPFGYLH